MKFKIEVDVTPEEFRSAMGLPDIAGLQSDVLKAVKSKMEQGVEGFDPASLLKGWLSQGLVTASQMQRMVFGGGDDDAKAASGKSSRKD